jgi:hypothetical protein
MDENGIEYDFAQPWTFRFHSNRAFVNYLNAKCTRKVLLEELIVLWGLTNFTEQWPSRSVNMSSASQKINWILRKHRLITVSTSAYLPKVEGQLITFCQVTWCHIADDNNRYSHLYDNFKSFRNASVLTCCFQRDGVVHNCDFAFVLP